MTCSATVDLHGVHHACERPEHDYRTWHSARTMHNGRIVLASWPSSPAFIQVIEEFERTTAEAALAELCAGFERG